MSKALFIAATGKGIGKTSISLGLLHLLRKKYNKIAYIKPISQQDTFINKDNAREDIRCIKNIFNLNHPLNIMNPVIIDKGFTARYINGTEMTPFIPKILRAYKKIQHDADFTVIEGMGHPGVGSIIGISSAEMAKLLNADILLLGKGGIGSTIDEIMLAKTYLEAKGCRVIGVLINKVLQDKYDNVSTHLCHWFQENDIPLLGIIPYHPFLVSPSLRLIADAVNARIIHGKKHMRRNIEKIIVGTMNAESIKSPLTGVQNKTLFITSTDNSKLLHSVLTLIEQNKINFSHVAGILLSGKQRISSLIRKLLKKINIPVLMTDEDVYSLVSKINKLEPTITIQDTRKIALLKELAENYININKLCRLIKTP